MEPDELDWKIIDILRSGNESNNSLARTLDISEGTVRQRIKRLKEAGILEIKGLINPEILNNQQLAMIAITLHDSDQLETTGAELAKLENVLNVSITTGQYDLFAEVLIDSNRGLVDFLTKELPKVKGISKTESFLMLKSYHKFV
ncbi:MAG: Lrp/AsnC family transcriptional regulator [Spirochaetales bacterium]|nr:Lrp/AsnC family transcriptional regulator [Spirochaetales bacterium]